jgi:hypothetical protein
MLRVLQTLHERPVLTLNDVSRRAGTWRFLERGRNLYNASERGSIVSIAWQWPRN